MPSESGKPPRKPPVRSDALRVDLDFDVAIKAALETAPPTKKKRKRKKPANPRDA